MSRSMYPSSDPRATTRGSTRRRAASFCNLNISDLESRLDPSLFLRIHRSYIINLSQVNEILRDDGRMSLRMAGPEPVEIPVSRTRVPRRCWTSSDCSVQLR